MPQWYDVEVSVWVHVLAQDPDEAMRRAEYELPAHLNPAAEGVYDPDTGERL